MNGDGLLTEYIKTCAIVEVNCTVPSRREVIKLHYIFQYVCVSLSVCLVCACSLYKKDDKLDGSRP